MNYLINTLVTTWNEPPRARHQVANELKEDGKVYFVEKNKFGIPRIEVKAVENNVFIITPYYWLDYRIKYRTPVFNKNYNHWLFKEIKKLDISFDIVFTFDYTSPLICNFFNNVIFYSADDNVGLGKFNTWFIKKYHSRAEKHVAQKAKICIVTSEYMLTKIKNYNPYTYLVPLGAPIISHQFSFIKSNKSTPVLGLVGYLDNNLDYNLLQSLLKRFKIFFIGPISKRIQKKFYQFPGAIFLGVKTGTDLYKSINEIDVCIAPYDLAKINKGLTPNKLWLYLANGKPVVVTDIPNIKNWHFDEKLVYKCKNEEFGENCLLAFQENSPYLTTKRIETAKTNSWKTRVERIKQLFYENENNNTLTVQK